MIYYYLAKKMTNNISISVYEDDVYTIIPIIATISVVSTGEYLIAGMTFIMSLIWIGATTNYSRHIVNKSIDKSTTYTDSILEIDICGVKMSHLIHLAFVTFLIILVYILF